MVYLSFYLFKRKRGRQGGLSAGSWARCLRQLGLTRPEESQEARVPSGSLTQVAGTQVLEPSPAASPGYTIVGSWN